MNIVENEWLVSVRGRFSVDAKFGGSVITTRIGFRVLEP